MRNLLMAVRVAWLVRDASMLRRPPQAAQDWAIHVGSSTCGIEPVSLRASDESPGRLWRRDFQPLIGVLHLIPSRSQHKSGVLHGTDRLLGVFGAIAGDIIGSVAITATARHVLAFAYRLPSRR